MMPVRRFSSKSPGWDCDRSPCGKNGCGKSPGSGHGIHGEEWTFAVSTGEIALSMAVFTPLFPPTVPAEIVARSTYHGAWVHLHVAWRVTAEDIRDLVNPAACEYLSEKRCFSGGTWASQGEKIWAKHGRPSFEQSDAFWAALEAKLDELGRGALDSKTSRRCPVCDGRGIIKHHAGST